MAKHYVIPMGQARKPMAGREGETKPVFGELNRFLRREPGRELPHHRRACLFLLGDAGTGKTSLLLLLKAAHLTGLWTDSHACVLQRIGPTTIDDLAKIRAPHRTVVLLDGLGTDPSAKGGFASKGPRISYRRRRDSIV